MQHSFLGGILLLILIYELISNYFGKCLGEAIKRQRLKNIVSTPYNSLYNNRCRLELAVPSLTQPFKLLLVSCSIIGFFMALLECIAKETQKSG